MRVADYIFKTLADWGIKHVFLVTGGGAMYLNDALGKEKRIQYICNLHEQACAMAAEGYARISGSPGVISVTTGPGGTNAITGVMGAWVDSVPMMILSGQVKFSTTIASCPELKLRQLGDQEINVVDIVRPITKYAKMVTEPGEIVNELEKAWRICQTGRPGPVWLDIPLNVQAAELDESLLRPVPSRISPAAPELDRNLVDEIVCRLKSCRRPVIIAGSGIRNAHSHPLFLEVVRRLNVPVLTSISGIDLLPSDHPLFFGRPGILGERAANFIMQNSDLFLVLGTRMGIRIIGYAYEKIAREACRIMVDIDEAELNKPTFRPHLKVHADAGDFLKVLSERLPPGLPEKTEWMDYCRSLKKQYPVILPEHRSRTDYVSSYVLPELISNSCPPDTIVVTGNGTAYTSTFQAIPIREGMRMFSNEACASMGYGLPASIGAALAGCGRPVVCITGDGSIQMNLQELQTVVNYRLPIKIFVYNNGGYLSIKLTQKAFFDGCFVGSHPLSGVILPDFEKIAFAYGLPFFRLRNHFEAESEMANIFTVQGPALIEVMTDPFEVLGPKASSWKLPDGTMVSAPLEDLAPFLPREEFQNNMLIPVETENRSNGTN